MKNTKLIPIMLAVMLTLPSALAQVAINEVMYAPNQTVSETDSEWVELHNTGQEQVDLTGWKINGNEFQPAILQPDQYLVIARELTDSEDEDTDSFQTVWGTGTNAVDGSFTLSNTGATITLTDNMSTTIDTVTYTPQQGALKNGKTLERTAAGWQESFAYGGTPGMQNSQNTTQTSNTELPITLNVTNSAPEIRTAGYNSTEIYATVYDANGQDDIKQVYAKIADKVLELMQEADLYKADLPKLEAGNYNAVIYAEDTYETTNRTIIVTIDTVASMAFTQQELAFSNIKAGETKEETLEITNSGNVDLQLNFEVVGDGILKQNLQCQDIQWKNMTDCALSIPAGEQQTITLKLAVPEGTKAGTYTAKLQTTATVQ